MSRPYTVKPGDTLFKIAIQFFGDGNKYIRIKEVNPIVKNPDVLIPGWILTIPDLPERKTI